MSRHHPHDISAILDAAQTWRDRCLIGDGSLFSNEHLWTSEGFAQIHKHYVENLEEGEGTFLAKLRHQVRGSSSEAKKLLAEMLWVILLFPHKTATGPAIKRQQIAEVWGWSGDSLNAEHLLLGAPLESGIGNPGAAYLMGRWREVVFLARFGRAVKDLPAEARKSLLLSDGWKFAEWLDQLSPDVRPQLRHILAFLMFPDFFEPIASHQDKQRIVAAFTSTPLGDVRRDSLANLDRRLYEVRATEERELATSDLSFYKPPLRERWYAETTEQGSEQTYSFQILSRDFSFKRSDVMEAFARTREADWANRAGSAPRFRVLVEDEAKPAKAVFRNMPNVPPDLDFTTNDAKRVFNRLGFDVKEDVSAEGPPSSYAVDAPPLNRILYGPPGTGKTYATIETALEILDPDCLREHVKDRAALKARFDEFVTGGNIRLVTFHQSLSYEDFIEGLRAYTDDAGRLNYRVGDGIFKTICAAAKSGKVEAALVSANGKPRPFAPGQTVGNYEIGSVTPEVLWVTKPNGSELGLPWKLLDELAGHVLAGTITIEDIRGRRVFDRVSSTRMERHIVTGYSNVLPEIVGRMLNDAAAVATPLAQRWVLIIDEINRGNIARIFGELITLIEPSKRAGAGEALQVTLPYSKLPFAVPSNLYLIGTMNTADRSLVGLDIALRRRFVFEEMPPRPELLDGVRVGDVAVAELLTVMNERIERLLDRDHRLGHTYFMSLRDDSSLRNLSAIFRRQIVPLLQEYFFEDWERIRWILNDHRKLPENQFICAHTGSSPEPLGNVDEQAPLWRLNPGAFDELASYAATIRALT